MNIAGYDQRQMTKQEETPRDNENIDYNQKLGKMKKLRERGVSIKKAMTLIYSPYVPVR